MTVSFEEIRIARTEIGTQILERYHRWGKFKIVKGMVLKNGY